jgi:biopolymer transport protein ExbD
LRAVRGLVREELLATPEKPVVIIADRHSENGVLVDVIDECKLAGARRISIATEKE